MPSTPCGTEPPFRAPSTSSRSVVVGDLVDGLAADTDASFAQELRLTLARAEHPMWGTASGRLLVSHQARFSLWRRSA